MVHAVVEVDHRAGPVSTCSRLCCSRKAGEEQGQLHVLEGGEHRDEVVELEDEADVRGPPGGKLRLGQRR